MTEENKENRMVKSEETVKAVAEAEMDKKSVIGSIRAIQGLCLGIFTLGLSMACGDVAGAFKSPISSLSTTTMLFGGVGSLLCEFFARSAKK